MAKVTTGPIVGEARGKVGDLVFTKSRGGKVVRALSLAAAGPAPLVIGFVIVDGTAGTNIGPMLVAPHAGSLIQCAVVVKASDPSVAFRFVINHDGASVFTATQEIPAGAPTGTVYHLTGLTSVPLPISAGEVFTIDISQGSDVWQLTAQLE